MKKKKLDKQPFSKHLFELRTRLIFIVLTFLIGSVIGYQFSDALLKVLLLPLHQSVYYTSPIGGFNVVLTISFLFGAIVSLPMIIYQLIQFCNPILKPSGRMKIFILIFGSIICLLLGICFAYFIILPASLHFFSRFSSHDVKSLINASDYISFIIQYLLGFSLVFQLPIVLIIINDIKPLSAKLYFSFQRYIIVVAFLLGAILSPDPFTMALIAIPIAALYYISFILIFFLNKSKRGNRTQG